MRLPGQVCGFARGSECLGGDFFSRRCRRRCMNLRRAKLPYTFPGETTCLARFSAQNQGKSKNSAAFFANTAKRRIFFAAEYRPKDACYFSMKQ
jgi:hypothetical protein